MKIITLYRPVGEKELALVRESDFKRFPPRLEWQPIFYPVMNRQYAEQIAKQWNTEDEFSGYAGHVLSFDLPEIFIQKYRYKMSVVKFITNYGCQLMNWKILTIILLERSG